MVKNFTLEQIQLPTDSKEKNFWIIAELGLVRTTNFFEKKTCGPCAKVVDTRHDTQSELIARRNIYKPKLQHCASLRDLTGLCLGRFCLA